MTEQNIEERETLTRRIEALEARNKRVELDKAWEGSWQRKTAIGITTYIVVLGFLTIIHNDRPFINAVVPPVGFFLSTIIVKDLKKVWLRRR